MVLLSDETMGTFYNIKYLRPLSASEKPAAEEPEPDRLDAEIALAVEKTLDRVNSLMSTYIDDSELSRFNAHRSADPFPATTDTLHVFQLARRVSDLTGGAFDVTIGPIVNAYGFGPNPERADFPSDSELEVLRQRVGYKKIRVDMEKGTLTKTQPDLYCDLSAIAKGHGVDRVAQTLDKFQIQDYMVEIGGEVRAKGKNLKGVYWRIGVQTPIIPTNMDPLKGTGSLQRIVGLANRSMATSGDYRNYREVNGKRVSHTVDARTGRPIEHNLASVTVLHDSCAMADALATAVNVLGPEEGFEFAQKNHIAAFLIIREAPGEFSEKLTGAFPRR